MRADQWLGFILGLKKHKPIEIYWQLSEDSEGVIICERGVRQCIIKNGMLSSAVVEPIL